MDHTPGSNPLVYQHTDVCIPIHEEVSQNLQIAKKVLVDILFRCIDRCTHQTHKFDEGEWYTLRIHGFIGRECPVCSAPYEVDQKICFDRTYQGTCWGFCLYPLYRIVLDKANNVWIELKHIDDLRCQCFR